MKEQKVKPNCERCGRPIKSPADCGTEADGTIKPNHCKNCYAGGEFFIDEKDRQRFNIDVEFRSQLSGTVLDIGCGVDPFKSLKFLEKPSLESAFAIDTSETVIRNLKKELPHQKIKYLTLGAEDLPKLKKRFNYIFCYFSLGHFDNPGDCLKNISRCLKKGGKLMLAEELPKKASRGFVPTNDKRQIRNQRQMAPVLSGAQKEEMMRYIRGKLPKISEKDARQVLEAYRLHGRMIIFKQEIKSLLSMAGLKLLKECQERREWFAIFIKTRD